MKVPPPGRFIEIAGRRLHCLIQGHGTPVVVLEAGIAASSVSWALIQSKVAGFTTVLSYDRAGFGWSDAATSPGTALDAVGDLQHLLEATGLPGPYVLVGHSFGGLIVRLFEQHYPAKVAGLVLVDPVVRAEWRHPTPERLRMLARGVSLSRRGALLARLGVVRAALTLLMSGSSRVPKLLARFSAGKGAGVADRLVGEVRKMPPELWPAIAAHWSEPRSFLAMANNLESLPVSVAQLDETRELGELPLIVISASNASPEHAVEAKLSRAGEHIVAPAAGHWVQLDAPDLVTEAIRRICSNLNSATQS